MADAPEVETHADEAREGRDVALVDRPTHLGPPIGRHPLVPLPEARNLADTPMAGLGQHAFDAEQRGLLLGAVDPETMLDVLPTGEVYMPQVHYRRVLNAAFGPGAWGLLPIERPLKQDNTLIQQFALVVHGQTVAVAFGEQTYYPNGRMTWATAYESAKSNALMRCCKDLGVASDCWDKRFVRDFLERYCQRVWVGVNKKGTDKVELQWRRADAPPLTGEKGPYRGPDSKPGAIARPERTGGAGDDLFSRAAPDDFLDEAPPPPAAVREAEDDGDDDDLLEEQLRESLRQRGEDPDAPPAPPAAPATAKGGKATNGKPAAKETEPAISDAQRRRLLALCREHGVALDTLRAVLGRAGIAHLNEIPAGQKYDKLCAWVERGGK